MAKMLDRDHVDRKARLKRRLETKGGRVFEAGTVLTINGTYRGKFELADMDWRPPAGASAWSRPAITKVNRCDFELLEITPTAAR